MNIVILAAGQGKRMQSSMPKVLHSVAGKPMLGHVLSTVNQLDADHHTCVVVGHGAKQVENYVSENFQNVTTAIQAEQKGTGHAVAQATEYLKDVPTTLILYGDVPLIQAATLKTLLQLADDGALAVLTLDLENPTGYGRILRNLNGEVSAIVEEKDASSSQKAIKEINTGILACPTKALKKWLGLLQPNNAQGEYYLTDIISLAVQEGMPVRTHQPDFALEVQGVNSREQLVQLEREYQVHLARGLLERGVSLADPMRMDIRGNLQCASDVYIDVGCVFEGEVHLASGVRIGPYCVIKNSTIGQDTQVQAYSHFENAQVGAFVAIGPFARLRPGAQVDNSAHIGNFVEIKNSEIGQASKVNHLSYIGDTKIGSGVNIGAGTITCNYDGVNKHQTIIEDNAFIGSNSLLVAPVTVGKGATLGAGTTLTQDAPENQLTISRVKQVSLAWDRPAKKNKK